MILIAIRDDELRDEIEAALERYNCPCAYRTVKSAQEAQAFLEAQSVRCVVMTVEVALTDNGGRDGLLQQLPPRFPTVTLVSSGDGYPAYLYDPKMYHDWCTIPFSLDELFSRIDHIVKRAENGPGI